MRKILKSLLTNAFAVATTFAKKTEDPWSKEFLLDQKDHSSNPVIPRSFSQPGLKVVGNTESLPI